MVTDYERRDFWKTKVKVVKCNNKKSWYYDKVGKTFELESSSVGTRYVLDNGVLRSILEVDSEVIH